MSPLNDYGLLPYNFKPCEITVGVCKKVLRDHSVTLETKLKRIEGLFVIGNEFISRGADPEAGINDLITRIGPQTGLFGEVPKPNPAPNTSESDCPLPNSEAAIAQLLQELPQLSTKEMKAYIAGLGGSSHDCLEKKDLEQRLRRLLLGKLSDEVNNT